MYGVKYCSIRSSWEVEDRKRFSDVVYYNVIDRASKYDESTPEHWSKEAVITLIPSQEAPDQPLTLDVTVLQQFNVALTGFHIVSNARHIELSSDTQGYLCTKTGELCAPSVFTAHWTCSSKPSQLQLKFVSCADKTRLKIHEMRLDITGLSDPPTVKSSSVKMETVSTMMHDMGLEPAESAHALMKALEVAEHRQSGEAKMAAGLAAVYKKQEAGLGLAALSSGCSDMQASGDSSGEYSMTGVLNSVMSVLGIPTVLPAEEKQMYHKLQDMCNLIGQQRLQQNSHADQCSTEELATGCAGNQATSIPESSIEELKACTATDLNAMEERIINLVDDKLSQVENKLDKKLDLLLAAVCKHQHDIGLD